MSLSSLLVQSETASIREVEEALARQVLYGGDLVTNLLEVTHIDEARLTGLLAESFERQPAPAGELPAPSNEAKALVPRELCVQHGMVPLSVDDAGLVVAVSEPMGPDVEQEIGFTLSISLAQRIAPYVRVQQALAREYHVLLERRMERLLLRLAGADTGFQSSASLHRGPPVVAPPPRPLSELPGVLARPEARLEDAGVDGSARIAGATGPAVSARVVYARSSSRGVPQIVGAAQPGAEPGPPPTIAHGRARRGASPREEPAKPRVKRPRRRRGPMIAETAGTEMEAAEDRDSILEILFEYCRQFFDYTALFIVHGDVAEGWDAFGDGAPRERVLDVGIPLDVPSLLATARSTGRVIHAMPTLEGLDAVWMKDLSLHGDSALVIAPVVVGKRSVAMLIGDGGAAGVDPDTVDQVVWISGLGGAAFERIIVRRKLVGFQRGDRVADARVEASHVGHVSSKAVPPAPRLPTLDVPAPDLPPMPPVAPMPATDEEPPVEPLPVTTRSGHPPRPDTDPEPVPPASADGAIVAMPIIQVASMKAPPDAEASAREAEAPAREAEAPAPEVPPHRTTPTDDDEAPATTVDRDPAAAAAAPPPPPSVPPDSEQRAVPLHAPPAAQAMTAKLPSIIVADTFGDYGPLVDRFVDRGDEKAHAELLRAGRDAMPAIMSRFPGPLRVDASTLDRPPLPRASECGPLLALVAGQRKVALPFVLEVVADPRVELRTWATLLLAELPYTETAGPLVVRLFDDDARVRSVARAAARAVAEHHAAAVHERISKIALDAGEPAARRVAAMSALGELRNASAVPSIIHGLSDPSQEIVRAAHDALVLTTRHDVGLDPRKWLMFWQATGHKHRIEWLIDALTLDNADLARAAAEELVVLSHEDYGYPANGPKKDRERVQGRYRGWWATEGRARFRRA